MTQATLFSAFSQLKAKKGSLNESSGLQQPEEEQSWPSVPSPGDGLLNAHCPHCAPSFRALTAQLPPQWSQARGAKQALRENIFIFFLWKHHPEALLKQ